MKSITGCGIYAIINEATGRVYVGSTVNILRRWEEHRTALEDGTHSSPKLRAAWQKHGAEAFRFVLLERCAVADLWRREEAWIADSDAVKNGYNVLAGPFTNGFRGGTHSVESRAKMSAAHARNGLAEKNRQRVWTPEMRHKLSLSQARRLADPAVRATMSLASKRTWAKPESRQQYLAYQNDPERGVKDREALTARNRQRVWSKEIKHKISLARTRAWADPARRVKNTIAVKRAMADPAVRAKLSSATRLAWTNPNMRARFIAGMNEPDNRRKISERNRTRAFSLGQWAKESGHLERLAAFHRGRKRSPETLKTLSEAQRRRYAKNPDWLRRACLLGGRAIGDLRRGKSYDEIYGPERAALERAKRSRQERRVNHGK